MAQKQSMQPLQSVQKRIKLKTTKPKDPHCPKRSQSSYFVFMNERRSTLKSENPDKSMPELTKMIAIEWNEMSNTVKSPYEHRAAKLKEEYNITMQQYKQSKNYKKYQRQIEKWKKEQQQSKNQKIERIIIDEDDSSSDSQKTEELQISTDSTLNAPNNPNTMELDEKCGGNSTSNRVIESAEFSSNEQLNDKINDIESNINELIKGHQEVISSTSSLMNLREILDKIQDIFKKEWIDAQREKLQIYDQMKLNDKTHFESARSMIESEQREYNEIQADDHDIDSKIKIHSNILNELKSKKEMNRIRKIEKAEILNERRLFLNEIQKTCNQRNERMEGIKRKMEYETNNIFNESVKNELNRFEANYYEWNVQDVIEWIKFIENKKFNDIAYVKTIKQIENIEICGDKLSDLRNESVLKLIGINGNDQQQFIKNVDRVINERTEKIVKCTLCAENPINSVFIPCGHQFCCFHCYQKKKEKYQNCPICRKQITNTVKTFMNGF